MTEDERLEALLALREMRRRDPDVGMMLDIVVTQEGSESLAHLAGEKPEVFDMLFEQAQAMEQVGPR